MKKLFTIFLLLTCGLCFGQNLIPNWGFEQYDTCPNLADQIERCIGWNNFGQAGTTPDYYNACDTGYMNVPNGFFGYQQDHRYCSGYVGLVTYETPITDYREFIGIQLNQPLAIGQQYFLSFYTVMVELLYPNGYHFGMPTNNIGMRLSTFAYSETNPCPIDNFAHLRSIPVINDSINWNLISGSLVADSAYSYLIIGNFFDDINTDTINYTCDSCTNIYGYYYIDDVCLSTDSAYCNGGIENVPCIVGIHENSDSKVNIFPNPFSNQLIFTFADNKPIIVSLYNFVGQQVLQQTFTSSTTINTEQLAEGIYFYELHNNKGIVKTGKVVKQ